MQLDNYTYQISLRPLTPVLKQVVLVVDLISPFIVKLFSLSLAAGQFPTCDCEEDGPRPRYYRCWFESTTSNLPVLSKLLNRLIDHQLMYYALSADLIRSAGTDRMDVSLSIFSTVGSRAVSVAAPLTWNSLYLQKRHLRHLYRSSVRLLKTFIFRKSYTDITIKFVLLIYSQWPLR